MQICSVFHCFKRPQFSSECCIKVSNGITAVKLILLLTIAVKSINSHRCANKFFPPIEKAFSSTMIHELIMMQTIIGSSSRLQKPDMMLIHELGETLEQELLLHYLRCFSHFCSNISFNNKLRNNSTKETKAFRSTSKNFKTFRATKQKPEFIDKRLCVHAFPSTAVERVTHRSMSSQAICIKYLLCSACKRSS